MAILKPAVLWLALAIGVNSHSHAGYPSPADWRDEVVYQVITDRFFDGDPSNNNAEGSYNPSSGREANGGDWAGVRQKLDYIQSLGATAIWISPVVLNKHGSYHGYAAKDFRAYSPMFGDLPELRKLVDSAHARNMRVIIDMVCNHMADYIGSDDPGWPAIQNPGTYHLKFKKDNERPASPWDNLAWYHNNGRIDKFIDPNEVLGELSGLDDLKTELPAVRDELVSAYQEMILKTDCDGFRIDTVKHVEHGFWQTWCPRIQAYCASVGKKNFIMFGEVLTGDDAKCASYTGTKAGGPPELNSLLYYSMYFATKRVFESNAPTSEISKVYAKLGEYDSTARRQLVTFLDNHDQPRFLSSAGTNGDTSRLPPALTFEVLSMGVPCIYYGTEQGFDGNLSGRKANDPFDREDMFAGKFEFDASVGDNFNETHPLFTWTQRLLDLRHSYDVFRRGEQKERWNFPSGPGIYAFSRVLGNEEALVAVNSSANPQGPNLVNCSFHQDEVLVDAITGKEYGAVLKDGKVALKLEPHGSLALVRKSSYKLPAPAVDLISPAHDASSIAQTSAILVRFNLPMDAASVSGAFSIKPDARCDMQIVSGSTFSFKPATPLSLNQLYEVKIAPTAHDAGGQHRNLPAAFESRFTTASDGATSGSASKH